MITLMENTHCGFQKVHTFGNVRLTLPKAHFPDKHTWHGVRISQPRHLSPFWTFHNLAGGSDRIRLMCWLGVPKGIGEPKLMLATHSYLHVWRSRTSLLREIVVVEVFPTNVVPWHSCRISAKSAKSAIIIAKRGFPL